MPKPKDPANMTVEELEALIKRKKKIEPLQAKRDRLAAEIEKIDAQIAELEDTASPRRRRRGRPARKGKRGRPPKKAKGKRRLSAEARARIIEAQKRRWAQYRKQQEKKKAAETATTEFKEEAD